jgi:hypothetical protein
MIFKVPVVVYAIIECKYRPVANRDNHKFLAIVPLAMNNTDDGGYQVNREGEISITDRVVGVVPAAPGTFAVYDDATGQLVGYKVPGGTPPTMGEGGG